MLMVSGVLDNRSSERGLALYVGALGGHPTKSRSDHSHYRDDTDAYEWIGSCRLRTFARVVFRIPARGGHRGRTESIPVKATPD
jgi:hypothetical protein